MLNFFSATAAQQAQLAYARMMEANRKAAELWQASKRGPEPSIWLISVRSNGTLTLKYAHLPCYRTSLSRLMKMPVAPRR